MTPRQRALVDRHLLDQGAPLSAGEYVQLRRELAADAELARYFDDVAATRVDARGGPVMSPRQLGTILSAAEAKRPRAGARPRLWLGGFAAAAGLAALALVVTRGTAPSGSVVLRGGDSTAVLPSFHCAQGPAAPEVTSCAPGEPLRLQGTLFPRQVDRGHLAVVTCDERFSCALVARRERGRDERAVTLQVGPTRPLRIFAVWTEDVFTDAQLAQASERLKLAGFELRESPLLPVGRAFQSSVWLAP